MNQVIQFVGKGARSALNAVLAPIGYEAVHKRRLVDFFLHKYPSYETYRDTQIRHNIRKLDGVWADEVTLRRMCDVLRQGKPDGTIRGLCHGTRNGFEQNFISSLPGFEAMGTDISPTAVNFPNSVQWDFHDVKPEWVGAFDFVYSNSLDQSWNPRAALVSWLNQVRDGGYVVIELTELGHSPMAASEMDPFGVRPVAFPYVLLEWFGLDVASRVVKGVKFVDTEVWLFFIRKLKPEIA